MKNYLLLISGQQREFEKCLLQQLSVIRQLQQKANVYVLINFWSESYQRFPIETESFVELVDVPRITSMCSKFWPDVNLTIRVTDVNYDYYNFDSQDCLESVANSQDFYHVAYLNWTSLQYFFELEQLLGIEFDAVVRIRPDLYIHSFDFDDSWSVHNVAYLVSPVSELQVDQHRLPFQFHDGFEVYGRTAFIAYGQMALTLNHNAVPGLVFIHQWVIGHLKLFGIHIESLPESALHATILRPLYRIDQSYKMNTFSGPELHNIDQRWRNALHESRSLKNKQDWLDLFDLFGVKYRI